MTQLHQLLAVVQGTKTRAQKAFTAFYHQVQKPEPFSGIIKTYQPKDDDGEQLPGEGVRVQRDAEHMLQQLKADLAPMYKAVGELDRTNQSATANIVVDGTIILVDVPVATLLWLEKQLTDMRTVFERVPVLNPEHTWTRDESTGVWTTPQRVTLRAKKVPRNHVKAEATEKHPAQVEVYYEDVNVGSWYTKILSGGMQQVDVRNRMQRLDQLINAVKEARARANAAEVQHFDTGAVLDFVFGV